MNDTVSDLESPNLHTAKQMIRGTVMEWYLQSKCVCVHMCANRHDRTKLQCPRVPECPRRGLCVCQALMRPATDFQTPCGVRLSHNIDWPLSHLLSPDKDKKPKWAWTRLRSTFERLLQCMVVIECCICMQLSLCGKVFYFVFYVWLCYFLSLCCGGWHGKNQNIAHLAVCFL